MRRLVVAVVGLLGFAVLVAAFAFLIRSSSQTNADVSTAGADNPAATQVSVLELYRAYHANEAAADNEYKGKRLYVEGLVGSINKNFAGQVYLVLPTYNQFESVQAGLNESSYAAAAGLQKGEIVAMECDGAGMILLSPMLDDCVFVSERKSTPAASAAQPVALEPTPEPTLDGTTTQSPLPSQSGADTAAPQTTETPKTEDAAPPAPEQ